MKNPTEGGWVLIMAPDVENQLTLKARPFPYAIAILVHCWQHGLFLGNLWGAIVKHQDMRTPAEWSG